MFFVFCSSDASDIHSSGDNQIKFLYLEIEAIRALFLGAGGGVVKSERTWWGPQTDATH